MGGASRGHTPENLAPLRAGPRSRGTCMYNYCKYKVFHVEHFVLA